jgi:hypothetical protein
VRRAALALAAALGFVAVPGALAGLADEQALATRYAPVVRLVEQPEECGHGEPYRPLDVNVLFDEPSVALRGPWNATDLVKIAPTAQDLVGRFDYHLDFPGHALDPGCGYEKWSRRITAARTPAVYAHVAGEADRPGKLALQYWLFYAYNDWNNLHEGDWEMIQLVFDAADAKEALGEQPVEVGYSQHEGAERAGWDDEKLDKVGVRPVVLPAAGSHANFFDDALHIGSSAEQGVGCDDTREPHVDLNPAVITIPSDSAAARESVPWIGFEGRWGELQHAFYNGPTGPNLKTQWTAPIRWSEGWRSRSYAVPTGGLFGTGATDFFCGAVSKGSRALVGLLRNPTAVVLALLVMVAALLIAIRRTTWSPVAPLRLGRRRTWGQILAGAGRMYVKRVSLFLGIGLLLIPMSIVITVLQKLVLAGFGLTGVNQDSEVAGVAVLLAVAIGTAFTILGLALVQAATACALLDIDQARPTGPVTAYRRALTKTRPLLGSVAIVAVVWALLSSTAFLVPIAVWLAVRWALVAQVVEFEGLRAVAAVHRSAELVRGRWWRVASIVGVGSALAIVAGPFVGTLLILLTDWPLSVLNLIAGVAYALSMPFVALATSYVYLDLRVMHELADHEVPDVLPAEIQLSG